MLRLRQVHFPFPYLCLNGMILPTASLNCFVLSQLLPCSIQNLPSSFVYITEMNIDRTKVITVLVLCNTQLYFLLLEKWHQQLDVSTSCKVCNMMSIYSLEKSFKSPWTWNHHEHDLARAYSKTFWSILSHYFAHIHVLSVHTRTQRLDKDLIIIFSLWKFTIADFSQIA